MAKYAKGLEVIQPTAPTAFADRDNMISLPKTAARIMCPSKNTLKFRIRVSSIPFCNPPDFLYLTTQPSRIKATSGAYTVVSVK